MSEYLDRKTLVRCVEISSRLYAEVAESRDGERSLWSAGHLHGIGKVHHALLDLFAETDPAEWPPRPPYPYETKEPKP